MARPKSLVAKTYATLLAEFLFEFNKLSKREISGGSSREKIVGRDVVRFVRRV
jgi:hypothetical protein